MAASLQNMVGCKLCKSTNYCHWRLIVRFYSSKPCTLKRGADVDPAVSSCFQNGEFKIRKHPGIMRQRRIQVPERLDSAVNVLAERYLNQSVLEEANKMNQRLQMRHVPIEDLEKRALGEQIRADITKQAETKAVHIPEKSKNDWITSRVNKMLKTVSGHWQSFDYTGHNGLVYVISRLAKNYSVISQCLLEIHKRDEQFVPRSVYNYGSGTGSCVWAAHEIWKKSVFEYYCVDPVQDMNTIARLLLQDGEEQKQMYIRGVYFRQFSPSDEKNTFELVVSGYTLLEQPNRSERLKTIERLWNMTQNYLVLVEVGSFAGYSVIMEARDFILHKTTEDQEPEGHVFAPCPHDLQCPKKSLEKVPCTFEVDLKQLAYRKGQPEQERYSYIIIKRGKRNEGTSQWPRLIQPSVCASDHTHCKVCCPDGYLNQVIITKSKHSRELYKCSQISKWGDLLPIIWTEDILTRHNTTQEDDQFDQSGDTFITDRDVNTGFRKDGTNLACADSFGLGQKTETNDARWDHIELNNQNKADTCRSSFSSAGIQTKLDSTETVQDLEHPTEAKSEVQTENITSSL
ncbi:hypothetical protein CHS0354_020359 [Potamilus streckersoni]|uniref:Methyltransferase-like protein 17, mitochondrial n=1 Tax=Potamilus streckersoni TaxID=2493646 RepID=A0AAE0VUX6_9BIVA|nr:hypothetical protein CHS0354_020359 [Potamilus streckersoni]